MDIFISWQGEKSLYVAEQLQSWIKMVLQNTKPWISSKDLAKGSRWNPELSSKLEAVQFGIICLTRSNLESNWIHFEAGAISKSQSSNVWTLLLDLDHNDVKFPLAQFNHSIANNKEDFFKMIKSINDSMNDQSLESDVLDKTFNKNWDDIEAIFKEASKIEEDKEQEERSADDLLNEILSLSRDNTLTMGKILQLTVKNGYNSNRSSHEFNFGSEKSPPQGPIAGTNSPQVGSSSKPPPPGPRNFTNEQVKIIKDALKKNINK